MAYDPQAACPTWEAFLRRILAEDEDLIRYVQKAVGYSLTGSTDEQCLFILHGSGANGKSTFLNTIGTMLGGLCPADSNRRLLVKRGDSISNDVARLHGARFVSAVEVESGRRLAEAQVKQLTGGDLIAARFLYREFFEFRPAFKLFLGVNHTPVIQGSDHGIWRRIHLVPFTVTIAKEDQDKRLGEKLQRRTIGHSALGSRGLYGLAGRRAGAAPEWSVRQLRSTGRRWMSSPASSWSAVMLAQTHGLPPAYSMPDM